MVEGFGFGIQGTWPSTGLDFQLPDSLGGATKAVHGGTLPSSFARQELNSSTIECREKGKLEMVLTGRCEDVLPQAANAISKVIADFRVRQFYIGRTNNPGSRQKRHGANGLRLVYQTRSTENAQCVEEGLLRSFSRHPKFRNAALDSRGSISEGLQYVYLALWTSTGFSYPDFVRNIFG